ncbi:MAG: AMP-binding protein [Polyangiales bacterium]
MSFVSDILLAAQARDKHPLLIEMHGQKQQPLSGRAFVAAVSKARGFLQAQGVVPGDRVGLLGPNASPWAAIDLAILAQGAISVPLYSRQDPKQLAGMLADAAATLLLVADTSLQAAITPHLPAGCAVATYESALNAEPLTSQPVQRGDAPVTIIYTSGTSGEPKGVVLTADNVDYMLDVTGPRISRMTASDRHEDRVFHYLPFCFAGSRIMLWSQLRRGNPLWMSTDLNNLQVELAGAKPHYFLNVPVLLERIKNGVDGKVSAAGGPVAALYKTALRAHASEQPKWAERTALTLAKRVLFPRIKRLIGENLEFLVCGSAPLSAETQRWFSALGLPIYQVYGLTETTGIVTIDDTDHVRIGRVGQTVDGCELKLSETGELLCRGPNIFAGYYRRPEATAEVLQDGWFHTGDQCDLDADGSLKIIGRLKDVIVPESGHNVAPAPIEARLQRAAAGIDQAVVVGHGRPFLTALVTGTITDSALDAAIAEINQALPHYQRLRKAKLLSEPFTPDNGLLTANQKLRRKAIEHHYRDAIEELYR